MVSSQSSREWNKAHPERMRKAKKRFLQVHPDYDLNYGRQWRLNHPHYPRNFNRKLLRPNGKEGRTKEQIYAWGYIHTHPELRGSSCEFCGSTEELEAHHLEYTFPDIVVTCCASCHMYVERGV